MPLEGLRTCREWVEMIKRGSSGAELGLDQPTSHGVIFLLAYPDPHVLYPQSPLLCVESSPNLGTSDDISGSKIHIFTLEQELYKNICKDEAGVGWVS